MKRLEYICYVIIGLVTVGVYTIYLYPSYVGYFVSEVPDNQAIGLFGFSQARLSQETVKGINRAIVSFNQQRSSAIKELDAVVMEFQEVETRYQALVATNFDGGLRRNKTFVYLDEKLAIVKTKLQQARQDLPQHLSMVSDRKFDDLADDISVAKSHLESINSLILTSSLEF